MALGKVAQFCEVPMDNRMEARSTRGTSGYQPTFAIPRLSTMPTSITARKPVLRFRFRSRYGFAANFVGGRGPNDMAASPIGSLWP